MVKLLLSPLEIVGVVLVLTSIAGWILHNNRSFFHGRKDYLALGLVTLGGAGLAAVFLPQSAKLMGSLCIVSTFPLWLLDVLIFSQYVKRQITIWTSRAEKWRVEGKHEAAHWADEIAQIWRERYRRWTE